jgi:hypothetical protein
MNSNKPNSKNKKIRPPTEPLAQIIPLRKVPRKPLSQASPEDLLDQFQTRFFEARFQIRQLELKIAALEETPHPDVSIIADLRLQAEAILNRQRTWIQRLSVILMTLKDEKQNYPPR